MKRAPGVWPLILLLQVSPAWGDAPRVQEKNLISLEILGRGGYGSIQYDRTFSRKWAVGVGVGAVTATTYAVARSLTSVTSTRVEPWYMTYVNYYLAGEYLSPYLTAGLTYIPGVTQAEFTAWPGAGIEFRTHVGPTLRLAFYFPQVTPLTEIPGYPEVWAGLALGFAF